MMIEDVIKKSILPLAGPDSKRNGYNSNTWDGCIKCHHWSFDWKYHDSSVCNPCGIRFLTIYHRKIIEYLIRGRLAKIKS